MKSKWEKLNKKAGEYSDKDYAAAERYAKINEKAARLNKSFSEEDVDSVKTSSYLNYLKNLGDESKSGVRTRNVQTVEEDLRKINSVEQYNHEREAGDPNALRMSYEDWKNLQPKILRQLWKISLSNPLKKIKRLLPSQ